MSETIKTDCLIVGAGPVGLFAVFELGILGLSCEVVDNLDKIGGQCAELYPDKPIYDIPALPECTGLSLIENLQKQIKPFNTSFHLNERIDQISNEGDLWIVKTSANKVFETPNIFIAGGVGSFEPRKPPIESVSMFEGKGIEYSIPNKDYYAGKKIVIFGGGDSALDWTVELSKIASHITLVHRRNEFKAAQHTVSLMEGLVKEGKVDLITNHQISDVLGDKHIKKAVIKRDFSKLPGIDDICVKTIIPYLGNDGQALMNMFGKTTKRFFLFFLKALVLLSLIHI